MRRKGKIRNANEKLIYIFSEGETENCYFNQIKKYFNLRKLKVKENLGQLSGNNKTSIVNIKNSIFTKIEYTKNDLRKTKSVVCYLLDIDGYNRNSYTQTEIDFIKKNFEDDNFKVFFSNKDFELWVLLHLSDYKKEDGKYIEKIEEITKKEYKKGNCNIDFFRKIIDENLKDAIKRGKKLEKYQIESQGRSELKLMNPFTEVYKIFDELEI